MSPQYFIAAPTPVLKDNNSALNMGTKLIKKINNAPGARKTQPVRLCFLLSVIFLDG
jgi:hypothetical protein